MEVLVVVSILFLVGRSQVSGEPSGSQKYCGSTVSSPAVLSVTSASVVQRCRWLVLPPPSSSPYCGVVLEMGDPQPTLPPCPSNPIVVDGEPLCGQLPSVVLLPFRMPHTSLELRSSTEGGIVFNLTIRHEQCPPGCGGEFSDSSVTIQSPGYPSGYRPGLDCRYVIHPHHPGNCQVQVRFENSSLQKSPNCSRDFLQIGGEKLCGNLTGVRVYELSDRLDIRFVSDLGSKEAGFKLYGRQVECTDTVVDSSYNEKQDIVDCEPLAQSPIGSDQGYPYVRVPFPQLPLPLPKISNFIPSFPASGYISPDDCDNSATNVVRDPLILPSFQTNRLSPPLPFAHFESGTVSPAVKEQALASSYLPPTNTDMNVQRGFLFNPGSIPLFPDHSPATRSVYQTYQPNYSRDYPKFPPSYRPPYQNYRPTHTQNYQPTFTQNYEPTDTQHFLSIASDQCCGVSYSDSHFLLVSPGFPRSEASDCVYIVRRYTQLTFQIRFQFRYFWTGVDSGGGCSGGYLEIDGTR